jgi:RES domain-containing protein
VPSGLPTALRQRGWVCRGESQPANSTLDLISDKPNRWNAEGEPTMYVSGDPGLALVESGRHATRLDDGLRLFEMHLQIPAALDLRDAAVRAELALPADLDWILDRDRTIEVSQSLRRSGRCDAIIVPSAGALDDRERYNIVVFADDPARMPELVADLRLVGELRLDVVRA